MLKDEVRRLRAERGWNQQELASAAGLHYRTIQDIESGVQPRLETLRAIAEAFGLSVAQLLSDDGEEASA